MVDDLFRLFWVAAILELAARALALGQSPEGGAAHLQNAALHADVELFQEKTIADAAGAPGAPLHAASLVFQDFLQQFADALVLGEGFWHHQLVEHDTRSSFR